VATETAAEPTEPFEQERRTSSLELFWDLVFVFAVTQVTTLLGSELTWAGFGRSMLVLALVWWAWSAFVWAANAQSAGSGTLLAAMLSATMFIFVAGLSVPHAFGSEGVVFASTYAVVRFIHLGLYADASRKGNASWSAIAGFALTVAIGMALLLAGAFVENTAIRSLLWLAAVAIDYAGPAWLTRERLRGLQRVSVAHFAERYSLFVLICLGESVVAIGVGTRHEPFSGSLVAAASLGLLITVGLWWTYFARFAELAEQRLREHEDPVLAAADAYSYLHLVIVAGIIVFAVGVNAAVHAVAKPLSDPARLAMCGGVALYLVGQIGFHLRMLSWFSVERAIAALALLILYAIGSALPAWTLAGVIALLLAALCLVEHKRPAQPVRA
jgi:low temperature requirement protein LtrA